MQRRSKPAQQDLFPTVALPKQPDGLTYRPDILGAAEEQALIPLLAELPFAPFEFHGFLGKRRVVSFGWRYDYSGGALRPSHAIPQFLLPLRDRAAAFAGVEPEGLHHALVTEYAPGAGIGWHRDKPMFQDVIAVSLLSPCTLRFRRRQGDSWQRAKLEVEPRSAYLLRGSARRDWYHSIPPVASLRYSITFRNFVADYSAPE